MKLEFHPEALAEFEDAAKYYATCQDNLELRFIASIEAIFKRILEYPEWNRIIEDDIRFCLAHVFPYAVLYSIEPDSILVIAVMHCHREPGYWRHRVTRRS